MSGRSISPYERFGELSPLSDARLVEHMFIEGETLSGLADRYFGDWRMWRLVADRNNIIDARQIATGTVLLIPAPPLQAGRFESA